MISHGTAQRRLLGRSCGWCATPLDLISDDLRSDTRVGDRVTTLWHCPACRIGWHVERLHLFPSDLQVAIPIFPDDPLEEAM